MQPSAVGPEQDYLPAKNWQKKYFAKKKKKYIYIYINYLLVDNPKILGKNKSTHEYLLVSGLQISDLDLS